MRTNVLIFSVFQGHSMMKDISNHGWMKRVLRSKQIPFTEVTGSYKGVLERSLIVDSMYEVEVQKYCLQFSQESYLFITAQGQRLLQYLNGDRVNIGQWCAIDSENLPEAWTMIGNDYYTCKVI